MKNTIIVILILVVLSLGGYVVYQETKPNYQPVTRPSLVQDSNTAPVTPEPVPTVANPDPTADWKTYTNEKYGFEFKYPANHTPYSDVQNDKLVPALANAIRINLAENEAHVICCEPTGVSFVIGDVSADTLADSRLQKTAVGGREARLLLGEGNLGSGYKLIYVKTSAGDWLTIGQTIKTDFSDQILSTFRFTK